MPFCPECGKPVAAKAKFCRACGASQAEEPVTEAPAPAAAPVPAPDTPSVPAPPPAPAPAPAPVAAPPAVPEPAKVLCLSCGHPLDPGEKFCGSCGTASGGVPSPAAPAPAVMPAPAPAAAVQRICTACGNPIKPGDKYCSKCLVMVKDPVPAAGSQAPAPVAPAPAAAPAPVPAAAVQRICTACGNPIKPGDKYCSKCLVMVKDPVPAAGSQVPAPVAPVPATAPAPAPAASGARVCRACGNPINPGDKYCSKCLVTVKDETTVTAPAPVAPTAAPVAAYVCASCGNPLSGTEKFCGVCGAAAVAASYPAAAPAVPAGKFCNNCGAPVTETTKFCGGCGAPVGASFPSGTVTSTPPASGEQVIGVIGNAKKMKMFGASYDTYNIVVTDRRMILVQMTAAMLNAAVAEAQAKAKAEGKGFFGIMKDQLAAQFQYSRRYETMNPDQALAETPGNAAVQNSAISGITLQLKGGGFDDDNSYSEFRMTVVSAQGSLEYMIAEDDRFVTTLKTAYGDRVKMPFGYFKAGGVRIKFF